MQGMISADSFGHYRLELSVDLTEEEGDQIVHQPALEWIEYMPCLIFRVCQVIRKKFKVKECVC